MVCWLVGSIDRWLIGWLVIVLSVGECNETEKKEKMMMMIMIMMMMMMMMMIINNINNTDNNNNNTTTKIIIIIIITIIIIAFKDAIRDFLQSSHCGENCLHAVRTPKWPGRNRVQIPCST